MALSTLKEMSTEENLRIVLIGNPGVGKSTLLNSLAGTRIFESGVEYGEGKTKVLGKTVIDGITFIDTPGLSDDTLREAAAQAITEAFQMGGNFKLFFICSLDSGRPRPQDKETMRLVLSSLVKAVPQNKVSYAVIFNKLTAKLLGDITADRKQAKTKTEAACLSSLPVTTPWIHYELRQEDADDEDNVLVQLSGQLTSFVSQVPSSTVIGDQVEAVNATEFDQHVKKLETQMNEMHDNEAKLTQELIATREQAEEARQKMEQQQIEWMTKLEEKQAQGNEELKQLKVSLEDKHEKTLRAHIAALEKSKFAPKNAQVIHLVSSSEFVINLHDNKQEKNASINLWESNGHESQKWLFQDGMIKLEKCPQFVINVHDFEQKNGATINLWENTGHDSQRWIYEDGKIKLRANTKYVLNVHNFRKDKGAVINLWEDTGHPSQQWKLADAEERVVQVMIHSKLLQSKLEKEGDLNFEQNVHSGYSHSGSMNDSFRVPVSASVSAGYGIFSAQMQTDCQYDIGTTHSFNWTQSINQKRSFHMPAGDPAYIYQLTTTATTNRGNVLTWDGHVMMTSRAVSTTHACPIDE